MSIACVVLIFPGTAFGDSWNNYLRITTLQPTPVLAEAVERMKPVMAKVREEHAVGAH